MPAGEKDPFWLGQSLFESGAITEEQFASAKRAWRKRPGESFAAVIERLGLEEPGRLAQLIALRHGLPLADLSDGAGPEEAARLLPRALARDKCAVPFGRNGRALDVAAADPGLHGRDELSRDLPGFEVRLHVAPREDILEWIDRAWQPAAPAGSDAGARFQALLRLAVSEGATDLHLEPRDDGIDVRHRIDGRLVHLQFVEQAERESLVQAAKIAGRMDISERRLPQDGRGRLSVGPRRYDLRFSCLPAVNGESVVVRIFDERGKARPLDESGFFPADLRHLRRLLDLPHGLVYVTGPTGAGKTTLLHAMLGSLPRRELAELKIITLEEPVELRQPRFFLQLSVDERIGRTFAELLRHALRHDPDVLLVGETRDPATAATTLKAALTGHLCFSTLHTNDALGAVARLADLGLDPVMVSCALKGVVAQRLVRRPCPRCREPHPHDAALRERFGELLAAEAVPPERTAFFAAAPGRDCPLCRGRGYQGRIAVVEVFPLAGLERLVARRAGADEFLGPLRSLGCRTLFEDGVRKAALGMTTIEEVHGALAETGPAALATMGP